MNPPVQQFDQEVILSALDKILTSTIFKSQKHQQFLTYLVQQSLSGSPPKETAIAVEFFNKDLLQQKDTSYVRVAAYHIRKKLNEYYLTEGKSDEIRLTLEKGIYRVSFSRVSPPQHLQAQNTNIHKLIPRKYLWLSLIAIMVLTGVVIYQYRTTKTPPFEQNSLFKDLSANSKPVLVVLGDLFLYHSPGGTLTRDFKINTIEDLQQEKPDLLELNKTRSRSKFMTRLQAVSLYYLSPLLNDLDKDIYFRMASELTIEDLKENNILYLGLFKSLYLLDSYFQVSNFEPIHSSSFLRHKKTGDILKILGDPGAIHTDYGMFSRLVGLNENVVYLIAGFTDTSVERIAASLVLPSFMSEEIVPQFPKGNLLDNFEVFFEVAGYDRKEVSKPEIVQAYRLPLGISIQ